MIDGLILRFDAPMMSFGNVKVDQHNVTDRFPGLSLIAGLISNALGWNHSDAEKLQQLQDRLLLASRWDVTPVSIVDYQTVDLGQQKMREPGWTTQGIPKHREGGPAARFGTHQRYRHYLANGILTSVIALVEAFKNRVDKIMLTTRRERSGDFADLQRRCWLTQSFRFRNAPFKATYAAID